MGIKLRIIGAIHTPFHEKQDTPIQSSRSDIPGTVEVFPEYLEGLEGVEDFSHLILLYAFHRSSNQTPLRVKPFLDDQMHGIFATRYPVRPNPLGISVVQLTGRQENLLHFKGADMLDGTPLLDIKPYVPEFDIFAVEKTGWYQNRKFP
jgi:tRNA (adenine37-N6)-methyltransferase